MCERIPYLILPMRQLSREPFGKLQMRRTIRRSTPMRASRQARHRACLDRTIRRSAESEPSGKTPGPSRTIRRSDTRASCLASRWTRLEACTAVRAAAHTTPSTERSVKQAAATELRAIRHSSCCRRYRTEPLRLFTVNPLTEGELGRRVIGEVILV